MSEWNAYGQSRIRRRNPTHVRPIMNNQKTYIYINIIFMLFSWKFPNAEVIYAQWFGRCEKAVVCFLPISHTTHTKIEAWKKRNCFLGIVKIISGGSITAFHVRSRATLLTTKRYEATRDIRYIGIIIGFVRYIRVRWKFHTISFGNKRIEQKQQMRHTMREAVVPWRHVIIINAVRRKVKQATNSRCELAAAQKQMHE